MHGSTIKSGNHPFRSAARVVQCQLREYLENAHCAGLLMSESNSGFPQSQPGTGVQTLPSPIHTSKEIAVMFLVCT
jgi:hypothetical protein